MPEQASRSSRLTADRDEGLELLLKGVIEQQQFVVTRDPWLPKGATAVKALLLEALQSEALEVYWSRGVVGLLESDDAVLRLIGPVVPRALPWTEESKRLIDELCLESKYRGYRVKVAVNSDYRRYWSLLEETGFRRYNAETTMVMEREEWSVYSRHEPRRRSGGTVRFYEETDEPILRRIHPEDAYFSPDTVIDRRSRGIGGILIVEGELRGGQRPVGYLYYELTEAQGEICFVNVDEAARGNGFGTRLVTAALEHLFWEEGAEGVELSVRPDNPAADLYRRIGFSPVVTYYSYQRLI